MNASTRFFTAMAVVLLLGTHSATAQNWNGTPPHIGLDGTNGEVWDIAVIGSDTYVVGSFTEVGPDEYGGTIAAVGIARWTGSHWESVEGPAIDPSSKVRAITEYQNNIVIGGNILTDGADGAVLMLLNDEWLALDDSTEWDATLPGTNIGQVFKLLANGPSLFAAGGFNRDGCKFVCEYSGGNWNQVGGSIGDVPDRVYDLIFLGSDLYAAGDFPGGIARRSGSSWLPVGEGFYSQNVYSLEIMNGELYAGGNFGVSIPGNNYARLARWDQLAGVWQQVFPVPNVNVWELRTMQCDGEESLYAFGAFTDPADHAADYGDGSGTAIELDGGVGISGNSAPVRVATCTNPDCNQGLLVGGEFASAGPNSVGNLAEYVLPPGCGIEYSELVTTTADGFLNDGRCGLREAIHAANTDAPVFANEGECAPGSGADVIRFDPVLGAGVHQLTMPDPLEITSDITIEGLGQADLTIRGSSNRPMVNVKPGARLVVTDLFFRANPGSFEAIDSELAEVTLDGVRFYDFRPPDDYPLLKFADSLVLLADVNIGRTYGEVLNANNSVVRIENSLFLTNLSNDAGERLIEANASTIEMIDTELRFNAFAKPMIEVDGGELDIHSSALVSNVGLGDWPPSSVDKHAIEVRNSSFQAVNSTFSRNTVSDGALLWIKDPVGVANIQSNTFYLNTGGDHGQVRLETADPNGNIKLSNNMMFRRWYGRDCRLDGPSTAVDSRGNLARDLSGGCGFTAQTYFPGLEYFVTDLAGKTPVHLPTNNSPLIDAADPGTCPATDQHGQPRPVDGDGDGIATCDVGAYEVQ